MGIDEQGVRASPRFAAFFTLVQYSFFFFLVIEKQKNEEVTAPTMVRVSRASPLLGTVAVERIYHNLVFRPTLTHKKRRAGFLRR